MERIRGRERCHLLLSRQVPFPKALDAYYCQRPAPISITPDPIAFYGALFPTQQFLLFFVLPLPAWAMIGGIFAYDAYGAIFRPGSGTDSAGHVGGILAGLGAALLVRRRGFRGFRF